MEASTSDLGVVADGAHLHPGGRGPRALIRRGRVLPLREMRVDMDQAVERWSTQAVSAAHRRSRRRVSCVIPASLGTRLAARSVRPSKTIRGPPRRRRSHSQSSLARTPSRRSVRRCNGRWLHLLARASASAWPSGCFSEFGSASVLRPESRLENGPPVVQADRSPCRLQPTFIDAAAGGVLDLSPRTGRLDTWLKSRAHSAVGL